MIRALLFASVAGALVWYWARQRLVENPAAPSFSQIPGFDQIPQPYSPGPDPSPMAQPALDPLTAAILQVVLLNSGDQDPALIMGLIEHESGFNPQAVNSSDPNGGSFGLMQMQLPTAQQMGYPSSDPSGLFDPATSIALGVAYLDWIASFLASHGIVGMNWTIAAYNEGVGNALKGLPNLGYVNAVLANANRWRVYFQGVPMG